MKKLSVLLCLVLMLGCFGGCGLRDLLPEELTAPVKPASDCPPRMVRQIEVALHPETLVYGRTYQGQKALNGLIHLFRAMDLSTPLTNGSDLDRCKSFYSFTVTYANGHQTEYRMLSNQYIREGPELWYEIDQQQANTLTRFILENPSDNSMLPTPEPTETVPQSTGSESFPESTGEITEE